MTTETWIDLPTLQDVAKAQYDGWEIVWQEKSSFDESDPLHPWDGSGWSQYWRFRGRHRQPKMKKVKLLGWFDGEELRLAHEALQHDWVRVPSEDKEIEIPE